MDTENKEPEEEAPIDAPEVTTTGAATKAPTGAPEGDHTMAMLCHLVSFVGFIGVPLGNILGPLVLWLIKKDEDALVDATGKEVLNFQISAYIYGVVCLPFILLAGLGVVMLIALGVAVVVYTIIGALKANEGQLYRYPYTIRLIK